MRERSERGLLRRLDCRVLRQRKAEERDIPPVMRRFGFPPSGLDTIAVDVELRSPKRAKIRNGTERATNQPFGFLETPESLACARPGGAGMGRARALRIPRDPIHLLAAQPAGIDFNGRGAEHLVLPARLVPIPPRGEVAGVIDTARSFIRVAPSERL